MKTVADDGLASVEARPRDLLARFYATPAAERLEAFRSIKMDEVAEWSSEEREALHALRSARFKELMDQQTWGPWGHPEHSLETIPAAFDPEGFIALPIPDWGMWMFLDRISHGTYSVTVGHMKGPDTPVLLRKPRWLSAGFLTARFESYGAGSRLRLGWARRWSIRRIAARVTSASETSGSAS